VGSAGPGLAVAGGLVAAAWVGAAALVIAVVVLR
jgi:hypothetical protein